MQLAENKIMGNKELYFKEESYKIIGCAMEVHRYLGNGFKEEVYQEDLEVEFDAQGIKYERESPFDIYYKGVRLRKEYFADFLCYDDIVVELKAVSGLTSDHESQVINYLKASKCRLAILINFGARSLQYKRLVNFLDYEE